MHYGLRDGELSRDGLTCKGWLDRLSPLKTISIALLLALSLGYGPAFADGGDDTGDEPVEDADASAAPATADGAASPVTVPDSSIKAQLTIEGLVLTQDDLVNVPFTKPGANAPTPFVSFNSSELGGDEITGGLRGTLKARILDHSVEFSAFYMQPISLEQTKLDLGEGANPANTDAIYYVAVPENSDNAENIFGMTVHHETKLLGGEANIVRPLSIPGLVIGARGIYFGEQLGVTVIEQADDVPGGADNTPDRDNVGVRVDNHLFGLQAGLQGMFDIGDYIRAGGSIKGGLFNNYVTRRRTFQLKQTPATSFESNDDDNVFAQGVEINPRVEFRLADGVFLTASGTFLWLNNVGQSLPHLSNVTDASDRGPKADGDTYFYGGSLGLTFLLDSAGGGSTAGAPIAVGSDGATLTDLEQRIADLESTTARKGNENLTLEVSGSVNRMLMAWGDGDKSDIYEVDNTAARTRLEFRGGAKIARGLSAGYFLSVGIDDAAANDVNQLTDEGDGQIEVRHSTWWLRHNKWGTVHVGLTSPATDDIILKDVGGIMPGAANISTIGGNLIMRHADEYEQDDNAPTAANNPLITRTTLDDFAAGAGVDTLRRNVVRYDAPRVSGLLGSFDLAVAWGEDDFFDVAAEHRLDYNNWKFRFGAGYLKDTDEGGRILESGDPARRDRSEYKGSASLLHIPSGLFGTVAYVHRMFNGIDDSDQAVFGENTTGLVTPAGTNRPSTDYLYTAFGVRQRYSWLGDTSIYGELARVDDAITGLREGGLDDATNSEVTDSRMDMVGAAISQNIDAASMDVYMGFRYFTFDVEGARQVGAVIIPTSPETLTDISIAYTGARIKF